MATLDSRERNRPRPQLPTSGSRGPVDICPEPASHGRRVATIGPVIRPEDDLFARYCERRDPDALGEVFDHTARPLLAVASHLCGRADAAEDLVQQTFLTAIEAATTFTPGRPVFPWLVGILTNHARQHLKKRARTIDPARLPETPAADPAVAAARTESTRAVREAVADLGEPYLPVLTLHLQHGLDAHEIAAALGRPAGTVRTQLVRGLARLRQALPAGLAVGAMAMATSAGSLLAMRKLVVTHATRTAWPTVAAGVAGGMLMTKSWWLGLAAAVMVALSWWAWHATPDAVATALEPGEAASLTTASVPQPRAGGATARPSQPAAHGQARAPVPDVARTGRLRVSVRGPLFTRVNAFESVASSGSGGPLGGVGIVVRDAEQNVLAAGSTDLTGAVLLEGVPVGRCRVQCRLGFGRDDLAEVEITADSETTHEFFVGMSGRVTGRVVDADGAPVADADVWLGSALDQGRPPDECLRRAGRSDANGGFDVLFANHEDRVAAGKPGYAMSASVPTSASTGAARLILRRASGTVRGLVTDLADRPLAAACVGLEAMTPNALGRVAWTDAAGRFTFADVAPGPQLCVAVAAAHRSNRDRVQVAVDGLVDVRLRLAPTVALTGTITDPQRRPVPDAWVTVETDGESGRQNARTDAAGRYAFAAVSATRLTVVVARAQGRATARATIDAVAGMPAACDLVLPDRPGIRGRVVDVGGRPIAGIEIATGTTDRRSTSSDHEGAFALPDLGAGRHALEIAVPRGGPVTRTVDAGTEDLVVTLPIDTTARARVRGRIAGANGEGLAGTLICSRDLPWQEISLGADGRFDLGELPLGEYELFAECADHCAFRHRFTADTAGELDLGDLRATPAGRLRVRVFHPDGRLWTGSPPEPLVSRDGHRLQRDADYRCSRDGEAFLFEGLAAGQIALAAPDHDGLATLPADVHVRAGATQEVALPTAVGWPRTLRFQAPFGSHTSSLTLDLLRDGEVILRAAQAERGMFLAGFTFGRSLPPGQYEVRARADTGQEFAAHFAVRDADAAATVDVPAVNAQETRPRSPRR